MGGGVLRDGHHGAHFFFARFRFGFFGGVLFFPVRGRVGLGTSAAAERASCLARYSSHASRSAWSHLSGKTPQSR